MKQCDIEIDCSQQYRFLESEKHGDQVSVTLITTDQEQTPSIKMMTVSNGPYPR